MFPDDHSTIDMDEGVASHPPARIICIKGDKKGEEYQLTRGEITIGRANQNNVVLDDQRVSRFHAKINLNDDGSCTITDPESINGTFVKGKRITETRLEMGDEIRIGETVFRFVERGEIFTLEERDKVKRKIDLQRILKSLIAGSIFFLLFLIFIFIFGKDEQPGQVREVVRRKTMSPPLTPEADSLADTPDREPVQDLSSLTADTSEFFRKIIPSVVCVFGYDDKTELQSTGLIIDHRGYILTSAHQIIDISSILIRLHDGSSYKGDIIYSDDNLDIALIKIETQGLLPAVRIGDSDRLKRGDSVFTIGCPLGLDYTITRGVISSTGRMVGRIPLIQTDVPVNKGNSGGPLFNKKGEVVGIIRGALKNAIGINFAVPINYVRHIIKNINDR